MKLWIMAMAAALSLGGPAWAAGSVGLGMGATAQADPALARRCAAAAVELADATPAAIYVQGKPHGYSQPVVQLWAGGFHWLCRPTADGRLGFSLKPRDRGTGFQNVQTIR